MPLAPGTRLGPYEIGAPIGKGGMGEVYRARDTKLDREVAIKVLPEEFAKDKERLARFEREAKVLASLNHPNIASIYGIEESDGVKALVLELVEGPTLAERIAEGPIPVEEALPIARQMAEALEAGHEAGVIHRDLKPANVKVREDGTVKVLDYGLAKALEGDTPSGADTELSQSPTLTRHGTQVGVILGTAAYMSPEQAKGKRVDKRTDIWAFGCCLFEALTGKRAFAGDTLPDTIARVLERDPVWEALPTSVPPALGTLLRRCLRKDVKRRLHDIADVRIELEEVEKEPPQAETKRSPNVAVVALVVGTVAGVLGWNLANLRETPDVHVIRSTIPLPAGLTLTRDNPSVVISPDGRYIAFLSGPLLSQQIHIRSLSDSSVRVVDGTVDARMLFFSPDGAWVGFRREGGDLMKVSVTGGAPIKITGTANDRGASWGSDGWIVFNRGFNSGLSRVHEDGGAPVVLTTPDSAKREKTHRHPEVLPDGDAVLFTLGTVDILSYDDASLAVLDLTTGEYRVILEGGMSPRYSHSGHIVYARSGRLLAVPFDTSSLTVRGTPIEVLSGVVTSPVAANAEFALSRNGSLIYAAGGSWGDGRRLVSIDREGNIEPYIDERRAYFEAPRYSPDGRWLAIPIEGANPSLWIYDIARETLSHLTSGFTNNEPAWFPTSDRIVFRSDRTGTFRLYSQFIAGTDRVEPLDDGDYVPRYPSFSPNADQLLFTDTSPDSDDLLVLNLAEKRIEPYLRTTFNERDARFSPDGKWIAYRSDATGRDEIYIGTFPASTRRWRVSGDGGTAPRWSGDGRELFYRNGAKLMAVDVQDGQDLVLGKPVELFESTAGIGREYDVSPESGRFVMIDEGTNPSPTHLELVQNWAEELKRLVPTEN